MSPPQKVNYDFGAAKDLSQALAQLSDKIKWLAWVRESNRAKYLDSGPAPWTGGKYQGFVTQFTVQQRALQHLAEEALKLKSQVDSATDQATTKSGQLRDRGGE